MTGHRFERVTGRRGLRDFLTLTDRLYADEPRYVPTPRQQIRRWWRDGVPMYVLRDATGTVVARTTLHTDADLDAKLGRRCQLFGLTEFTPSAARPLFDAITTHATPGRDLLFGPVALLPNQAGGVITSGYADRGFVDSAWNPPHYPAAYEAYGFARRFVSDTWICPVPAPAGPAPRPGRPARRRPAGTAPGEHPAARRATRPAARDAQRLVRPARLLHADLRGAAAAADRRAGVPAGRVTAALPDP
nr:hypothetical protein [Micromonospora provocatoris]